MLIFQISAKFSTTIKSIQFTATTAATIWNTTAKYATTNVKQSESAIFQQWSNVTDESNGNQHKSIENGGCLKRVDAMIIIAEIRNVKANYAIIHPHNAPNFA